MKVKDVIIKACDFVGKAELALVIQQGTALTEKQQQECQQFLSHLNCIREEVESCYQPNLQSQKFSVKNFKIEFSAFEKPLQEIYSIKDKFGRNVNYKIFDGYIFVCGKEVEVIYSSVITPLDMEGEFSSNLQERIFAYGVAREYYFANNLYEDANMWEERFKGALEIMCSRKSVVKIPQRSWI